MSTEDVKIKVGYAGRTEMLTLKVREGDLIPYDLDREYKVIGRSTDRVDAIAKVTGAAKYTYDKNLPKMLHGRMLRCPHPNANVKAIDFSKAENMKGVIAVLDLSVEARRSSKRFAWDAVAAVAAESEAIAEEACRAIEVEYEVLPFAVRTRDAMKPDAPQVGRRNDLNVNAMGRLRKRRRESNEDYAARIADVEKERDAEWALVEKEAHIVIEEEFETQCQTHTSLETHGVVCDWDGENLLCYASTQATFNVQRELRATANARDVRVQTEYVGGGFGSKFSAGTEGVTGARLAKKAGRPVKMMLDRREEHTSVGNRPDSIQKLKMALAKDGTILGYRVRSWGTPGSGSSGAGARNDTMYELGKVDKIEYSVRTNTGSLKAMRAPGFPQGVYALEQMMDIAAARLKMDPLEFRNKNDRHLVRPHEFEIGAAKIGWKNRSRKAGSGRGPLKRGIGCAGTEWFARGGSGASCKVRIFPDGKVEIRNGAQDIGTGTRTIMGMVAAEELGLEPELIDTFIGDTNDPRGPASGGSTTAPTLTPAARVASHKAKLELLALVASAREADLGSLDLFDGYVVKKRGSRRERLMTFEEACSLIIDDFIEVVGAGPNNIREGFTRTNSGAQFADVEVDTETGEVRVLRVVAVADGGKIINAKTAQSQVSGGVIQGLSYALFEDRVMDPQKGHMLNADMESYKIAGPVDTPEIEVVLVDVANGFNLTSCMGLGEPPVIATAAAIANAVQNAIGVRIRSIPITPKKVLEALAREEKK